MPQQSAPPHSTRERTITDTIMIITAKIDAKAKICFSVTDSGIGIPEDELNRIFEPFFRADNVEARKGTGLGLALVKQLLDACGGTIDVASNINVGSTFTVKVPLHVL